MITKNSDWELGAYLYEYNGDPFNSIRYDSPISLLSETFFSNCTKYFINKKFFYFDLSKDTYLLNCNVEFILRFYITLVTGSNNIVYSLTGYYPNPLQIKTKILPGISVNTTANNAANYSTSPFNNNQPIWITDKGSSFYLGTSSTDSVSFFNNQNSFVWSVMLRQI